MNRLAQERSPYLLQHAANPVDWYPWGADAFDRSRREDKPIFLSIGYSTCHWCHVMEHESFENAAIASAAERRFRVDQGRPRRTSRCRPRLHVLRAVDDRIGRLADDRLPDARAEAVLRRHLLSPGVALGTAGLRGSAGRARPRVETRSAAGRAGRVGTARAPQDGDRRRRPRPRRSRRSPAPRPSTSRSRAIRRPSTSASAGSATRRSFRVPPSSCFWRGSTRVAALPATSTRRRCGWSPTRCGRWRIGGMRDHIGGGFHRYSVDAAWRVPHFEKMLYDQAQLTLAYLEAAQATGDDFYRHGRRRHARPTSCAISPTARAGSTRPRTPTACRPNRPAIHRRTSPKAPSTSGPTPRLAR